MRPVRRRLFAERGLGGKHCRRQRRGRIGLRSIRQRAAPRSARRSPRANGFAYRRSGQSLIILPLDKVGADDPNLQSRTLQVPASSGDLESVLRAASMLLGSRGQMQLVSPRGDVLVVDTEERIERIERFFNGLRVAAPGSHGVEGGIPMISMVEPAEPQVSYLLPSSFPPPTSQARSAMPWGRRRS